MHGEFNVKKKVLMHFDSVLVLEEIWKVQAFSEAQEGGVQ
jgi:hypothetical protein